LTPGSLYSSICIETCTTNALPMNITRHLLTIIISICSSRFKNEEHCPDCNSMITFKSHGPTIIYPDNQRFTDRSDPCPVCGESYLRFRVVDPSGHPKPKIGKWKSCSSKKGRRVDTTNRPHIYTIPR